MPDEVKHAEPARQRLDALTSLRFFAAFFVAVGHVLPLSPAARPYAWLMFGHNYGVDFFFLLSGFVLCYQYGDKFGRRQFQYRDFLLKRFARLYPVHIATLAFYLLVFAAAELVHLKLGIADQVRRDLPALPFQLTMTHAWGFVGWRSFNGPAWSISSEWFAYLLFPVYMAAGLWICRRRWLGVPAALAVLAGMVLLTPVWFGFSNFSLASWDLYRIIPEFLVGVSLCITWKRYPLNSFPANMVFYLGLLVAIGAAYDHATSSPWSALSVFGSAGVIYAAASLSRRRRPGWIHSPLLIYGGEISYSIYMTHELTINVIYNLGPRLMGAGRFARFDLAILGLTLGLFVVVGAVSYHIVEVPAKRFITRHLRFLVQGAGAA